MIIEHVKKLFTERIGKRFDLDHWYDMLKDQPQWKTPRTSTTNVGSGSSKKSHSETENGDNETVVPTEQPGKGVKDQRGEKL